MEIIYTLAGRQPDAGHRTRLIQRGLCQLTAQHLPVQAAMYHAPDEAGLLIGRGQHPAAGDDLAALGQHQIGHGGAKAVQEGLKFRPPIRGEIARQIAVEGPGQAVRSPAQ